MSTMLDKQVLEVKVTLQVGLYFRCYLESIRNRLLVAASIYVVIAGAFVWFFSFIGEQDFLLKTSPLLLGLPALAIGGQLLRAHASYRKNFSDLKEKDSEVRSVFTEDGDGFDVYHGEDSHHIGWGGVRQVVEGSRYFQIWFTRYESSIVPKKSFTKEPELQLLREILKKRLGPRARLLT